MRRGFERLSPESRYRRFFTPKPRLSEAELDYLTQIDQYDHVAIGAFENADGAEQGLAVARFVRMKGAADVAEAAIAVVDDAQGQGLGSLLFQRLVAAARERGIRRFSCSVLGTNKAMQEMLMSIGEHVDVTIEDGVAYVETDLPELAAEHPPHEPPRENVGYRVLRKAAEGLVRVARPGTRERG